MHKILRVLWILQWIFLRKSVSKKNQFSYALKPILCSHHKAQSPLNSEILSGKSNICHSVKFLGRKIFALSPRWAVLSNSSPGVYTYWRCLCSLGQVSARATCSWSSGVLPVANTHIPGEGEDWIKWQGCRRMCINLQSREIHRVLFPKLQEVLEAFQHWRQW